MLIRESLQPINRSFLEKFNGCPKSRCFTCCYYFAINNESTDVWENEFKYFSIGDKLCFALNQLSTIVLTSDLWFYCRRQLERLTGRNCLNNFMRTDKLEGNTIRNRSFRRKKCFQFKLFVERLEFNLNWSLKVHAQATLRTNFNLYTQVEHMP